MNLDLAGYLLSNNITPEVDNFQVRVLNNIEHQTFENIDYSVPCTQQMLDIAIDRLNDHFCCVGITEKFDESIILLKRELGLSIPFYSKANISVKRPSKIQIPDDVMRSARERNKYDYMLYDYAMEQFQEKITNQDISFRKDLFLLQKTNLILNQLRVFKRKLIPIKKN